MTTLSLVFFLTKVIMYISYSNLIITEICGDLPLCMFTFYPIKLWSQMTSTFHKVKSRCGGLFNLIRCICLFDFIKDICLQITIGVKVFHVKLSLVWILLSVHNILHYLIVSIRLNFHFSIHILQSLKNTHSILFKRCLIKTYVFQIVSNNKILFENLNPKK